MKLRPTTYNAKARLFIAAILLVTTTSLVLFWCVPSRQSKGVAAQRTSQDKNTPSEAYSTATNTLSESETSLAARQRMAEKKAPARDDLPAEQRGASYWFNFALQKCVPRFDYRVEVSSQTISNAAAPATPASRDALYQSRVSMVYSPNNGLRLDTSTGGASFSVDVATMLRKMISRVQWTVDGQTTFEGEPAVRLSSTNPHGSITFWISRTDGAVLHYEQSIDGRQIASCDVKYTTLNGSLVPQKTVVRFPLTGRIVTQDYTEYAIQSTTQ